MLRFSIGIMRGVLCLMNNIDKIEKSLKLNLYNFEKKHEKKCKKVTKVKQQINRLQTSNNFSIPNKNLKLKYKQRGLNFSQKIMFKKHSSERSALAKKMNQKLSIRFEENFRTWYKI